MYLIGSRKIKELYPDFKREPKDYDYLITEGLTNLYKGDENTRNEYHLCPPLWNYLQKNDMDGNVMLTLKASHIFWDIFWEKHMYDIIFLFQKDCQIIKPLFYELYNHWNTVHGNNKRSDLKMTKEDFFNNALKKYDHDILHYLLNPTPIFTKILKDGEEVDVCEEKFNLLSFEDKLDLVREEILVMSFERLGNRDYRQAYSWMLKKFIISHAPIWEVFFILENHKYLYKPLFNYVNFFNSKLKSA